MQKVPHETVITIYLFVLESDTIYHLNMLDCVFNCEYNIMYEIQNYCRTFRVDILGITLMRMQAITGRNYKSISAFENGRSQSLYYLFDYIMCCETEVQKQIFINGISNILRGN